MRTALYRTLAVGAAMVAALSVAPAAGAASMGYDDEEYKSDHKVEEIHEDRDGYSEYYERTREKESYGEDDNYDRFYGHHHGHRSDPHDWRFGDPVHGDFSYERGHRGHRHHDGPRAGDGGGSR
ncbi:MAG: hypothetical protein ACT4QG_20000 [Sporichthyaceae bacterium]